jgi:hypothetical protein
MDPECVSPRAAQGAARRLIASMVADWVRWAAAEGLDDAANTVAACPPSSFPTAAARLVEPVGRRSLACASALNRLITCTTYADNLALHAGDGELIQAFTHLAAADLARAGHASTRAVQLLAVGLRYERVEVLAAAVDA